MAAAFIRLPALLLLLAVGADAWAASSWAPHAAARAGVWQRALCAAPLPAAPLPRSLSAASSRTVCSAEWAALGGGKAVWKRVLEPGSGEMPQPGADVEIEYVATLGERDWSVEDVVAVWLPAQQGMEVYEGAFVAQGVDGSKLLSDFTEGFVTDTLGVASKLHAKKLASAAKRLQADAELLETGTEFDSSAAKGPFKFKLGKGKVRPSDIQYRRCDGHTL